MTKKTIGIIGGMGPMATVDLFRRIVEKTAADSDKDHIHILIDNYPQIPDRTKAIMDGDTAVVSCLVESGKRLESAGADLIIIPCNTSHYFYDALCKELHVPIINMIEECAKKIRSLGLSCVALLATDGVLFSGIYRKVFQKFGIDILYPSEDGQQKVMNLIYNEIKAGVEPHPEVLLGEFEELEAKGAQAFILGCTELPLALKEDGSRLFIDTTAVLAEAAIQAAGYTIK